MKKQKQSLGIRNCIRSLRSAREDMTQQKLADLVGVTRHTIMAIEAAKYSPSLEVAFKISGVFELPLEEVFQYRVGEPLEKGKGNEMQPE